MDIDKRIIQGCKSNDRKYQKMLLEQYSGALMATAMRFTNDREKAKDMLQETWIKVFLNINKYNERDRLLGWMRTILIHQILKDKKKNHICTDEIGDHQHKLLSNNRTDHNLHKKELMDIINTLRSPAKEVFIMNIIEGLSHREIAAIMSIKESTSRVHLTNARKALKGKLVNTEYAIQ